MHYSKYLVFIIFFLPAKIFAQKTTLENTDITGLWKGNLYNDSTKQYYQYEIAISKEKGKLTGFSHTWFILDDKQYYGVKKVKIKEADGKIIIEDDGLIANNYPVAPAKGIKQLNILELNAADSIMTLSGPFTTNRTKTYSPLTGTINLQRKNDYWQSALVPHLEELGLVKELSFVKDDIVLAGNTQAFASLEKPAEKVKMKADIKTISIAKNNIPIQQIIVDSPAIVPANKNIEIAKAENDQQKKIVSEKNTKQEKIAESKTPEKIVVANIKEEQPLAKQNAPAEMINNTVAAKEVESRKTLLEQTVYFKSDSLQLTLYDNGEVDGDTVSVLMNGKVIMPKVGLSTNAVRKTIFVDNSQDSIQLVMYAENLGSIPPNTGLLVVKDGKDIYEIRFSGDLQKNAAIIFRRKKNN